MYVVSAKCAISLAHDGTGRSAGGRDRDGRYLRDVRFPGVDAVEGGVEGCGYGHCHDEAAKEEAVAREAEPVVVYQHLQAAGGTKKTVSSERERRREDASLRTQSPPSRKHENSVATSFVPIVSSSVDMLECSDLKRVEKQSDVVHDINPAGEEREPEGLRGGSLLLEGRALPAARKKQARTERPSRGADGRTPPVRGQGAQVCRNRRICTLAATSCCLHHALLPCRWRNQGGLFRPRAAPQVPAGTPPGARPPWACMQPAPDIAQPFDPLSPCSTCRATRPRCVLTLLANPREQRARASGCARSGQAGVSPGSLCLPLEPVSSSDGARGPRRASVHEPPSLPLAPALAHKRIQPPRRGHSHTGSLAGTDGKPKGEKQNNIKHSGEHILDMDKSAAAYCSLVNTAAIPCEEGEGQHQQLV